VTAKFKAAMTDEVLATVAAERARVIKFLEGLVIQKREKAMMAARKRA